MTPVARAGNGAVLPAPEEKRAVVEAMFDRIAGNYERVNRVISLGLDGRWRRRAVGRLNLAPGSRVLDVACGTGDLSRILRARGHATVGVDLSMNMLLQATGSPALVRADACVLPMADASVDGVVCGFALRNLVDLLPFFSECARVLRPGGRVSFLDAATPRGVVARAGHRVWFGHLVPWLGARLSEPAAYRYLAASTAYLPDRVALTSMLQGAGFTGVEVADLMLGAVWLLSATKP